MLSRHKKKSWFSICGSKMHNFFYKHSPSIHWWSLAWYLYSIAGYLYSIVAFLKFKPFLPGVALGSLYCQRKQPVITKERSRKKTMPNFVHFTFIFAVWWSPSLAGLKRKFHRRNLLNFTYKLVTSIYTVSTISILNLKQNRKKIKINHTDNCNIFYEHDETIKQQCVYYSKHWF